MAEASAVSELSVVGCPGGVAANQPIVLLKEDDGDRYLPIWIGAVEATAIAFEQQGVQPARPLTHDLLRDVIAALRRPAARPCRSPSCGTTSSTPSWSSAAACRVSARPSDAIALALRVGRADPRRARRCSTEAGIVIPDEQEDEVEKFREFLDTISPEDFAGQ